MTEQEMLQTWCSRVQVFERDDRTLITNRGYDANAKPVLNFNCIGHRCGHWRWDFGAGAGVGEGYCGLAGPP